MIYAVIAAGGTGSRAESTLPKQYTKLAGKPVIIHTTEKFVAEKSFRKIILTCPEAWLNYTKELIESEFGKDVIEIIAGGTTRNETIMKAVDFIKSTDGITDETVIITHDAVRPFVSGELIREHIRKAPLCNALGTVIPATDTVVVSENGLLADNTPDRSKIYLCQTPQSFKAKKLQSLYEALDDTEKAALTDTCSIFTVSGEKVELTEGDTINFKITYPHDLKIAEALMK